MASATSPDQPTDRYVADTVQRSAKILVVGAFGVGKTTLIGSISLTEPISVVLPTPNAPTTRIFADRWTVSAT